MSKSRSQRTQQSRRSQVCAIALTLSIVGTGTAGHADNTTSPPSFERVTLPAATVVCHQSKLQIKQDLTASLQLIYATVSSANLHPSGPPIVVFGAPIGLDVDPSDLTDWEVCLPISDPSGTYDIKDLVWKDLPAVTAIKAVCQSSDSAQGACSSEIRRELQTQGLKLTRLWSSNKQTDGTSLITLPVDAAVTP